MQLTQRSWMRQNRVRFATFTAMFAGVAAILAPSTARAELIFALDTDNELYSFDSATPGAASFIGLVSLPGTNVTPLSIDVRPTTGLLFTLGSDGNVYTLDTTTAVGTRFNPTGASVPITQGVGYEIDFNPVPNALRIVGTNNQNSRLSNSAGDNLASLNAGATPENPYPATAAGNEAFAISAAGYTDNDANPATTTTRLLVINDANDSLYQNTNANQPMPSNLINQGTLGVTFSGLVGFDVSGSGAGYLGTGTSFFLVNTAAGVIENRASPLGTIASTGGTFNGVKGLSAAVVPEPGTITLLAVGVLGMIGGGSRLRRRLS